MLRAVNDDDVVSRDGGTPQYWGRLGGSLATLLAVDGRLKNDVVLAFDRETPSLAEHVLLKSSAKESFSSSTLDVVIVGTELRWGCS